MFGGILLTILLFRFIVLWSSRLLMHLLIIKSSGFKGSFSKYSFKMGLLDMLSGTVAISTIAYMQVCGVVDIIYYWSPGIVILKSFVTLAVLELIEQIIISAFEFVFNIHIKGGKIYNSLKLKFYLKNTSKNYVTGLAYTSFIFLVATVIGLMFGIGSILYNIVLLVLVYTKDKLMSPNRVMI